MFRFAEIQKDALIRLFDAYTAATGSSFSNAGLEFAGDTSFYGRLKKHRPNTRKTDVIIQKFSDAWPCNAQWPDGVPRPPVGKWDDLRAGEVA